MGDRSEVLHWVMRETGTTQGTLSRMSGVHQPSISGFLSGRVEMSDEMLDRLLSCMGFRLEVVRRSVRPELTRSEERSWRLHRQLSTHLTRQTLEQWVPTILANLKRIDEGVRGEPHVSNLREWRQLVRDRDVPGLRRLMTGLDTHGIAMREVSPLGGLLPEQELVEALAQVG